MDDEGCRLYWTKEQIFKFIRLVRQHPKIWNPDNKHFRNQFQKDLAYDAISYKMGITNDVVKKKIRILRTQYMCEVKKMQNNKLQKPIWPFFNAMKFFYEPHSDANDETDDTGDGTETFLMEEVNNVYKSDDDNLMSAKQPSTTAVTNTVTLYKWNHTKTLKLLETYQQFPELYNSNCFDFRNKYKRKLALESIAQQMDTSTEIIKKKMRALRTMYTCEVKKMKKNNAARPRWALFDAVKFLYDEPYFTARPKYNTGDVEIDVNDGNALENIIEYALDDDNIEAQYVDTDDESSTNTKQNQPPTQSLVEQRQMGFGCISCKERDEFATFGEAVASELRLTKDHEPIHKLLKQQILKALEEAKELMVA